MWHHTASNAGSDGQADADYIAVGADVAPLANLYIQRNGVVWVIAAGATNTNGSGNAMMFSKGTVPADSMNSYAVGVELANNGVGEPWPQAQVDAAFIVSNTVNLRCGNKPDDVGTHSAYAPGRKIDPATANAVQGPWRPNAINASGSWSLGNLAMECVNRDKPPLPEPDAGEDEPMIVIAVGNYPHDNYACFTQTPAGIIRWIVTGWELEAWTMDNPVAKIPPDHFQATVENGRTIGNINDEVVRITGVTKDRWNGRLIA